MEQKFKFKGKYVSEELGGYAKRLFRERKKEYVIRALNFRNRNDKPFFNIDEYELLTYELFDIGNKSKFMKECGFDEDIYTKLKNECFKKLEWKIVDLLLTDLKQSIYRPKDFERRLKKIFGENYPLKGLCNKVIVQVSRLRRPVYEITRAKEIARIADWHNLPWIYIREQKKNNGSWGISKITPNWMKKWFEEIDAEEYQKSPISIVMPRQLARLLLNILANCIKKMHEKKEVNVEK